MSKNLCIQYVKMLGKHDLITALTRTFHFSNMNCIVDIVCEKGRVPRNLQLHEEGMLQFNWGNSQQQ